MVGICQLCRKRRLPWRGAKSRTCWVLTSSNTLCGSMVPARKSVLSISSGRRPSKLWALSRCCLGTPYLGTQLHTLMGTWGCQADHADRRENKPTRPRRGRHQFHCWMRINCLKLGQRLLMLGVEGPRVWFSVRVKPQPGNIEAITFTPQLLTSVQIEHKVRCHDQDYQARLPVRPTLVVHRQEEPCCCSCRR